MRARREHGCLAAQADPRPLFRVRGNHHGSADSLPSLILFSDPRPRGPQRRHLASKPPPTGSVCLVIIRAAGEARKSTAAATSAVSAYDLSGINASSFADIAGSSRRALVNSVRTHVGATAFTRTPRSAHSTARARVRLTSAPLLA